MVVATAMTVLAMAGLVGAVVTLGLAGLALFLVGATAALLL